MEAKARRRAWRYVRQAVAIAARTGSISQAYIELGRGFADGIAEGLRSFVRRKLNIVSPSTGLLPCAVRSSHDGLATIDLPMSGQMDHWRGSIRDE